MSASMSAANSDLRVVVAGAGGRMGRTLIHAVAATKGVTLVGAVDAPDSAVIGRDTGELAGLGRNGIAVAGDVAPLLQAADALIEFTIPAATLVFAEMAAKAGLVHVIGTTGHSAEEEASVRGRDGMTGPRCAGDIGFASLRGGTVVGEHSVIFAGPAERLELTHRAEDRMIFARGALHAALWARGKKAGLYSMADVLGLRDI